MNVDELRSEWQIWREYFFALEREHGELPRTQRNTLIIRLAHADDRIDSASKAKTRAPLKRAEEEMVRLRDAIRALEEVLRVGAA